MPRYLYTILAHLALLLFAGQAQAQVTIDYFNFNSTTTPFARTTGYGDSTHTATTTTLTMGTFPTANFVSGSSGTPVNEQTGDTAGRDLIVQNSTTINNNGDYIQFQTPISGYNSLSTLSYATYRSNTGFTSEALSYSTSGTAGTYTTLSTITGLMASSYPASATSFDLSSINIQGASNIYLRLTFDGATVGGNGSAHIDNFTLKGVLTPTPAPAGVVSMGIGLGMAGLGALVRRRRQVRVA